MSWISLLADFATRWSVSVIVPGGIGSGCFPVTVVVLSGQEFGLNIPLSPSRPDLPQALRSSLIIWGGEPNWAKRFRASTAKWLCQSRSFQEAGPTGASRGWHCGCRPSPRVDSRDSDHVHGVVDRLINQDSTIGVPSQNAFPHLELIARPPDHTFDQSCVRVVPGIHEL